MNAEQMRDYNDLTEQMKASGGVYDEALIKKAFEYCTDKHAGQKRWTNEDYYIHPYNVAKIVVSLGMDSQSVAAALLHDVVEDTDATVEDIKREFGDDVALLVDGVTKIGRLSFTTKEQQQAESLRKMLIAMGRDIRVIIIKLADRLHNMRTIDAMPEQKQRDKSLETLEVYAPIAHRLGIRPVKEELEDLAIKHLDPIAYKEIEDLLGIIVLLYPDYRSHTRSVRFVRDIGDSRKRVFVFFLQIGDFFQKLSFIYLIRKFGYDDVFLLAFAFLDIDFRS